MALKLGADTSKAMEGISTYTEDGIHSIHHSSAGQLLELVAGVGERPAVILEFTGQPVERILVEGRIGDIVAL